MRVYLSSTLNDLMPERQAVKDVLGGECTVVESYVADERNVRDSCLSDVKGCNLYIGILGRRYGHIPDGESYSITELEFKQAEKCAIDKLIFIKDDNEIKRNFDDAVTQEHPPELIEKFRLSIESRAAVFKTPEELKTHVLKALLRYSQRHTQSAKKRITGDPYPGLRAFRMNEADRFFGRDAEIEELFDRIITHNQRFLAVIGASGSGKSSLVYAGLIPKLTASPLGICWIPVSFSPRELGDDPFLPLAAALKHAFPAQNWHVPDLRQQLFTQPGDIVTIIEPALATHDKEAGHKKTDKVAQCLLFVDQFEELFAAKVEAAVREAFFTLLKTAVTSNQLQQLRVVISMRSDFYSQWPQDDDSIALLRSGHFPLGVPGPAALEKMIVEPASAAGLTISPRLVQRILTDTGTAPGALALVEFALSQLYAHRQNNTLTEDAYQTIGGVAGAINDLAEKAVARVQTETTLNDETFTQLFRNIASVEQRSDDGSEALAVVRRRATQQDLLHPKSTLTLTQHLVEQRILVSRQDNSDTSVIYEVGHEAVFSHWLRFKDWHARYADDLTLCRQAEQAARDWNKQQRLAVLQWGWERQKPAMLAFAKLQGLIESDIDTDFSDPDITLWRKLEPHLTQPLRQFLTPEPLALLAELNTDDTSHQRREEIGLRLNQLGDPRRGVGLDDQGLPDIAWIDIPAGEITLKTGDHFEVPRFRIARYPVTWSQYSAFVNADGGYANAIWWQDLKQEKEPGELLWAFDNYPVINVSWYDAVAFCRWLSAKHNLNIRLPAEWEWQWAAIGDSQQDYPWPGKWNPDMANSSEAGIGRTVAVGLYPLGHGRFGIDDIAGNVWQWCFNTYDNPKDAYIEELRVRRGGSWSLDPGFLRASDRYHSHPVCRDASVGFRVLCQSPID